MKNLLLTGFASIFVLSVYTSAFSGPAKSPVEKAGLCKADCAPDGPHGLYKAYHNDSWLLKNEGERKSFNECVQKCTAPLPPFYVQRALLEAGGVWFGQKASDCLNCHADGPNLRVPR